MKYPRPGSYSDQGTNEKPGLLRLAKAADVTADAADVAIPPSLVTSAVPAATSSVEGKVELSTDSEAQGKSGSTVITAGNLAAEGFLQWIDTSLDADQIRALATTQIELVAAPGAGSTILFLGAMLKLVYGGSNAFTESDDNLGIKYTDDSGVQVCTTIECTNFIDATADTYTNAVPSADNIVAASGAENQALVLDNLGNNFAGNAADDNLLQVRVYYVVQTL